MSEWNIRTISECCEILDSRRVPLNEEERGDIAGPIPYYGANGLQGYINDYIFDEDLILIAEDGGYFDEYDKRPIAYRIHGKSWVNNHAHVLKAKVGYDQDFIFYSVEHKNVLIYIKGGTRSKLNQSELRQIEITVPDFDVQRKIALILTTLDSLIEKTEALIEKYQSIKQGVMHDLFTRGVTENGELRSLYEEAPDLYKQSELGWIPREWERQTIRGLAARVGSGITPTGGSEVYQNEGALFIRSQNVTNDGLLLDNAAFIDMKTHEYMKRSELYPYDVLLNITGASIGRCCVFPEGLGQANVNQHVCTIRIHNPSEIESQILSSILSSPIGQSQIFRLNAGGNRESMGKVFRHLQRDSDNER